VNPNTPVTKIGVKFPSLFFEICVHKVLGTHRPTDGRTQKHYASGSGIKGSLLTKADLHYVGGIE